MKAGRLSIITLTATFVLVLGQLSAAAAPGPDRPDVSCSTPLKLYNGTYLTGSSVSIYQRGVWVNLSSAGFDNMTSSYEVGACAVILASGANGGGSHYPECLNAGCVENTMLTGWNNVLSSVYLR
jgi:hypothetical protein